MKNLFYFLMIAAFGVTTLFAGSKRMVLVEEATNASCSPCAGQNPIFQKWVNDNMQNIIPIVYHASWPSDDIMYSENSYQNSYRIINYYGINGVPRVRINGKFSNAPANDSILSAEVSNYKDEISPLTINVQNIIEGDKGTVEVKILSDETITDKTLNIAVAQAYHYYEHAGLNGEKEFYWIMRQMNNDGKGVPFSITAGDTLTFSLSYDIDASWYIQTLYGVAFIQDDTNKEVLQAGASSITDTENMEILEAKFEKEVSYFKEAKNNKYVKTISVNNPFEINFDATVTIHQGNSIIPEDWTVTVLDQEISLDANGTSQVNIEVEIGESSDFCNVQLIVSPEFLDGFISAPNVSQFCMLSNKSKNIYFYGTTKQPALLENSLYANEKYKDNAAYLPFGKDVFEAYPASDFNFIWFGTDNRKVGALSDSTKSDEIEEFIDYVNDCLDAGGKVMINAPEELSWANDKSFIDFMSNKLHITKDGEPLQMVDMNSSHQVTGMRDIKLYSIQNDGITDTLNFLLNQFSGENRHYQSYGDRLIKTDDDPNTEIFMRMEWQGDSCGAAAKAKIGNGKIVYTSFAFDAFASQDDRNTFLKAVTDWFEEDQKEGAAISSDYNSIDFGSTDITLTKTINIINHGDEDLKIITMIIDGDDNFKTNFNSSTTIPVSEKIAFDIIFTPGTKGIKTADLVITSNAVNDPEFRVSLSGNSTSYVEDAIVSVQGKFTMNIAPNPIMESAYLTYTVNSSTKTKVKINLIDAAGNVVSNLVNEYKVTGEYLVKLESANLPSGTYYIIAYTTGTITQLPIVIIK